MTDPDPDPDLDAMSLQDLKQLQKGRCEGDRQP